MGTQSRDEYVKENLEKFEKNAVYVDTIRNLNDFRQKQMNGLEKESNKGLKAVIYLVVFLILLYILSGIPKMDIFEIVKIVTAIIAMILIFISATKSKLLV